MHCNFRTTNELAKYLNISRRTLERHRENDTGPDFIKVGGKVLYSQDSVVTWLESHTHASLSKNRPKWVAESRPV